MIANLAARIALTIIREQQTELTRLREALRPFAAAAVSAGEACGNSAPVSLMPDCPLFVGDLRRAAAALNERTGAHDPQT